MKKIAIGCLSLFISITAAAHSLKVTSSSMKNGSTLDNQYVFNGMDCTGNNISPELTWSNAPANTKFFAVTLYDPDAPTGSGWWHWVLFNIPATVTSLPEGIGTQHGSKVLHGAIESRTDFGKPGYGGPCPPKGNKPHHYIFKVYALKDKIPLDANASAAMVGFYIGQLKLAEGEIRTKYGRK